MMASEVHTLEKAPSFRPPGIRAEWRARIADRAPFLVAVLRLQPFLVTLATWSILSGASLLILPIDGGSLPGGWMWFGNASFLDLSTSVWILILLGAFWIWFRDTRLGIVIRAAGSNE